MDLRLILILGRVHTFSDSQLSGISFKLYAQVLGLFPPHTHFALTYYCYRLLHLHSCRSLIHIFALTMRIASNSILYFLHQVESPCTVHTHS